MVLLLPILLTPLGAATAKWEQLAPVLFEIEPGARYASTDLKRWEVFTRSGVELGKSLRLEFLNVDPGMTLEGQHRAAAKLSLYLGNEPSKWKPECSSFEEVVYRGIYPGVDLMYRRLDGQLKGDFIVHIGADPGRIRFRFRGGDVRIAGDRLELAAAGENLEERIPAVYEIQGGTALTDSVKARYRQYADGSIGYVVKGHDSRRELVIDPALTYSTYLASSMLDEVTALVYSPLESMLLVTGWTEAGDVGGVHRTFAGSTDGYYGRFAISPGVGVVSLSNLVLFGGSGSDKATTIAVGPGGAVAIGGSTNSANFPTLLPFQSRLKGSSDGFLIRFAPFTSTMSSSTYMGGTGTEQITGIALDAANTIYFAGNTSSKDLPVTSGAMIAGFQGGSTDGFAGTLTTGSTPALGYLTYVGGSGNDSVTGLAALNGEVYLTGATDSWDFPLKNPFQSAPGGGQDAFVTKLTTIGQLSYSTYLGGSGGTPGFPEMGNAITVSSIGEVYVVGVTSSPNFPVTSGALQTAWKSTYGEPDAFLTKFTPTGSLSFSTYLGGNSWDQASAVTILRNGSIAIAGMTSSYDFTTLVPSQAAIGSGGSYDAFVSVFTPTGTLEYSSFFGGSGSDAAFGLAGTPNNDLFLGGSTGSFDLPLVNPMQSHITSTGYHGFLSRLSPLNLYGTFRPSSMQFILSSSFVNFSPYYVYSWSNIVGCSNPQPVAGDWDNTGWTRVGLFCDGAWYLDLNGDFLFTPGVDQVVSNFGWAGTTPVVGDWDGTGWQRLGFYENNGIWILDIVGDHIVRYTPQSVVAMGGTGDYAIVGDFNNDGHTRLGTVRSNIWLLDLNGDHVADTGYSFGAPTDKFVFGDWDNTGVKRIGYLRSAPNNYPPGWFYFDITGNNMLDNWTYPCNPDCCLSGGVTGDMPLVGIRGNWRF